MLAEGQGWMDFSSFPLPSSYTAAPTRAPPTRRPTQVRFVDWLEAGRGLRHDLTRPLLPYHYCMYIGAILSAYYEPHTGE